jgi:hypothetical protein
LPTCTPTSRTPCTLSERVYLVWRRAPCQHTQPAPCQ